MMKTLSKVEQNHRPLILGVQISQAVGEVYCPLVLGPDLAVPEHNRKIAIGDEGGSFLQFHLHGRRLLYGIGHHRDYRRLGLGSSTAKGANHSFT